MSTPAKFLFDECLGEPMMKKLQEMVSGSPHFKHLREIFEQKTPDSEWIPEIAREGGWVVITSDNAKRSNRGGKLPRLCKEHKVTHILFSPALHSKRADEKLAALVLMWAQIAEVHKEPPGTGFKLRYRDRADKQGLGIVLEKVVDKQPSKTRRQRKK